jgi:hypothetical protein
MVMTNILYYYNNLIFLFRVTGILIFRGTGFFSFYIQVQSMNFYILDQYMNISVYWFIQELIVLSTVQTQTYLGRDNMTCT